MATWIRVWTVSYDGDRLFEQEASLNEGRGATVILRPVGAKGLTRSTHYARWKFEADFAETPVGAVEKFIAREQVYAEKAQQEYLAAERLIARGQALLQKLVVQ